jgi:hypothetical protein
MRRDLCLLPGRCPLPSVDSRGEVSAMRTIPEAARWQSIKARYPEAGHWFNEGWHYGALRHRDPAIRETSLGRLIDALLERETTKNPKAA